MTSKMVQQLGGMRMVRSRLRKTLRIIFLTTWDKEGNITFSGTYDNGESSDQNGLEPQYDDNNELAHYIECKNGVVVNESVETHKDFSRIFWVIAGLTIIALEISLS